MGNKKAIILSLIGVLVLTGFVLSPLFSNHFVWDDFEYIVRNETLAKPFSEALKFFFGQNYFVGNYHPLTMLGFSLEYHHAQLNPAFYHKVNWFLHLLNVALVFWFVFLLSDRKLFVAVVVSLLFGIHPMHLESVAWISELKDVLFGFFYLFGLVMYLIYLNRKGISRSVFYILCFILFILSLLSKPAAVSFPLTLMAIDFYHSRKFNATSILEKIPFLIGSVILGLITIKAQGTAVASLDQFNFLERIMLSSYALIQYLIKLIVPINLSAFHPFPSRIDGAFPWLFRIAPLIFIPLAFLLYKSLRISRLFVFGFAFFMVNIALVLQFVTLGMTVSSERYTYLPYIGLFFIILMYLYEYIHRPSMSSRVRNFSFGAIAIVLFIFSTITFSRASVWKSNKTLWSDVIKKYPECAVAHYNLGSYYFKENINDAQALISFNQTLKFDTGYIKAYVNRGILYTRMKEYARAETDLNHAVMLDANFSETYRNLGTLHNLMGQFEKAVNDYKQFLTLEPQSYDIYYGRGMTLYQLKRFEEAVDDFSKAIDLSPKNSKYWIAKSMALHELNKNEDAIKAAIKAQELGEILDPDYKKALNIN